MTAQPIPAAPDLDLLPSDVETDLRRSVRAVLAKTCPTEALVALADGSDDVSGPAWSGLAHDLGLAALLVPEVRSRLAALGFDEVFVRMWHFYLEYSRAGFASGYIDVNQLVLARPEDS